MAEEESSTSTSGDARRLDYSVRGLANWILDYADELDLKITNMALNKLVYFAFEKALLQRHLIITNAKIEAWEHGPVFREVYQAFKGFGDKPISSRASFYSVETGEVEVVEPSVSEEDSQFLRDALRPLIGLPASRLRDLSHVEGGAWHRTWWYDGRANPGMEIYPSEIANLGRCERAG